LRRNVRVLEASSAGVDPRQPDVLKGGHSKFRFSRGHAEVREQPGTLNYWITSSARRSSDGGIVKLLRGLQVDD
jgi:hypothetical protein